MDVDLEKEEKPSSGDRSSQEYGQVISRKQGSFWVRIIDGFRQNPNARVSEQLVDADGKPLPDQPKAQPALAMKLKQRHLQMIAIGGSIGTGLFIGSGSALSTGGPAALVISYCTLGIMLFCTVHALGEMAVIFPVAGSFSAYSSRFLDPAWGFAMGWNYAMQWLVTLPIEIMAASMTLNYWRGGRDVNPSAWVSIFFMVIIAINFFGVRGYGEAEFVFSIVKVIAVLGFIIFALVVDVGGGPTGHYFGAKTWENPGAFANGFSRVWALSIKQVFWRVVLFYIVSLTFVGLLVPWDDPRLLNSGSTSNTWTSPFVLAIKNAGVGGLPSVFNAVILIAVLSVGNASVYGASRTLAALADNGQAPKILGYIDREGRPLVAIIVSSSLGALCYIVNLKPSQRQEAWNWMFAVSGLASIFTWGSICLCHIRFRQAWKHQGHSVDELPFKSQAGVMGSWLGFVINCLVLVAQFWTGFAPVGFREMSGSDRTKNFFEGYLAAPVVIVFYLGFKIWKRTSIKRIANIDVVSGRREIDLEQILADERATHATWPWWKKTWHFFY
ncbi:histidine permease [Rhinocladiella similis]